MNTKKALKLKFRKKNRGSMKGRLVTNISIEERIQVKTNSTTMNCTKVLKEVPYSLQSERSF